MFALLILPAIPLVIVPFALYMVLSFRHKHGCNTCTAQHFDCARHQTGKSCPFFE